MCSPTTPKATHTEPAPSVPSLLSSDTINQEPQEYTRRAPTGFGSRLANARNLRPDEAAAAPPARSNTSFTSEDVGSLPTPPSLFPFTGGEAVFKVRPKYGGVKGSYISPYDSGGQVPGNKHLAFSSTTVEEFETKYGTAACLAAEDAQSENSMESDRTAAPIPRRSISFDTSQPVKMAEHLSATTANMDEVPRVPEGAQYRILFLGPFKLIRTECVSKKDIFLGMRDLDSWLSKYMHEDLHEVIERDEMLPSIIYTIRIKMTGEHWLNYNQALALFTTARDLHNLLSQGKENLDQVTRVHKNEGLEQLTWPQLTIPELGLGEMLEVLVQQNRLGVPWDFARMNYHPDLVPEELGGSLKNYPLYGREA